MKWTAVYVGGGGQARKVIEADDEALAKKKVVAVAPQWWERVALSDGDSVVVGACERGKRWTK
jgi:hypothetical protein